MLSAGFACMPIQVSPSVIAASMPTHARLVWFRSTVKLNIRARRVSSLQAYRWNRSGSVELFEIWSPIQLQTKRSCGRKSFSAEHAISWHERDEAERVAGLYGLGSCPWLPFYSIFSVGT